MIVMALLMLLPVAVAVYYGEPLVMSFLIPAAIFLVIGVTGAMLRPSRKTYDAKEGFVITTLSWILISVIGALPFVISGEIPRFIDAFFETVSGFTTTGSSILTNVEAMSKSAQFWRSFTHWVGGMGVLSFGIALFPVFKGDNIEGGTEAHILRAESPGPTYGKLVSKLRFNVRILYGIYFVMTVAEVILLIAGGMPVFDSILNSFGTAGTGGFGIKNASIGAYNSEYAEMVISVFMILFGVNFNVYYFMLIGKFKSILKHEELKWYLGIIAVSIAAITANLMGIYKSVGESFRYAFFQVSSIITTTGFATADFNLWPSLSKVILVLLMFIGSCAGSTGGGLKVSRIIILVKAAIKEVRHSINPRSVRSIRCDGEAVERTVVTNTCSYFAVYMILTAASVLLISLDGFSTTTSFTAVVACFNNIGPGLDAVGPCGNFYDFSVLSKIVLSIDMLLGRLEIFPLLIAFTPTVWKNK